MCLGKKHPKFWTTSLMPKVNNHLFGESGHPGEETKRIINDQDDQIGQFFAHLAMVCLLQFIDNYSRISNNVWASVKHGKSEALILTKNGTGYILGDFCTNSSGHPV
jgi:hypothetical protein